MPHVPPFLPSSMMSLTRSDPNQRKQEAEESNQPTMEMMTDSPSWKLYDNPHYSDRRHNSPTSSNHRHRQRHPYTCLSKSSSRSSYHTADLSAFSSPMGSRNVNLADLDDALAEIKELRAELEFARRMRRKVEALNKALAREAAEERRLREAAEGRCKRIGEEIAHVREEAERAMKEVEDERKMLRMAEEMREERVQMKLTEAKILMEERIKEMMPPTTAAAAAAAAEAKKGTTSEEKRGQPPPVENPHIKRGMKGMEFPRAVRVRANAGTSSSPISREGRNNGHLGSNLECQRAQLRVLMRNKSPIGSSVVGAGENLVT